MISLKVNDIVFLEELGVHARVQEVQFKDAPIPPLLTHILNDGGIAKYRGQLERPDVVVTLVQVDAP